MKILRHDPSDCHRTAYIGVVPGGVNVGTYGIHGAFGIDSGKMRHACATNMHHAENHLKDFKGMHAYLEPHASGDLCL